MSPDEFDWCGGEVTYWALDRLDVKAPRAAMVDELKEDLAQVRFGASLLLDVGWYAEASVEGMFLVMLVRDGNWDVPVWEDRTDSLDALRTSMEKGISVARKMCGSVAV